MAMIVHRRHTQVIPPQMHLRGGWRRIWGLSLLVAIAVSRPVVPARSGLTCPLAPVHATHAYVDALRAAGQQSSPSKVCPTRLPHTPIFTSTSKDSEFHARRTDSFPDVIQSRHCGASTRLLWPGVWSASHSASQGPAGQVHARSPLLESAGFKACISPTWRAEASCLRATSFAGNCLATNRRNARVGVHVMLNDSSLLTVARMMAVLWCSGLRYHQRWQPLLPAALT